ncbi:MAG: hypothetical protein V2A76_11145 [Planctomycetota bacterium]
MTEDAEIPPDFEEIAEPKEAAPVQRAVRRTRRRRRYHAIQLGRTLRTGFSIWFRNVIPFTLAALIISSPLFVLLAYLLDRDGEMTGQGRLDFLTDYGTRIAGILLCGFVSYSVFRQLNGHRLGWSECVRACVRRFWVIMGAGIFAGILIVLCLSVPSILKPFGWTEGSSRVLTALHALLIFAGYVAGAIVNVMLFVAIPVAVAESCGPFESLKRSVTLTRNNRWTIFWMNIILGMLVGACTFLATFAMAPKGAFTGRIYDGAQAYSLLALSVIYSSVLAALQGATYQALRSGREGATIEDLVTVFE